MLCVLLVVEVGKPPIGPRLNGYTSQEIFVHAVLLQRSPTRIGTMIMQHNSRDHARSGP